MPELPEMENYRQLLSQRIIGKTITEVVVTREKSVNLPIGQFVKKIKGTSVEKLERRAKYLLFYLTNGEVLLLHLMLGGWMFYGTETEKPDHKIQVQLSFDEKQLYFIGLRLGYLHLLTQPEIEKELGDLGPEPLDINFSLDEFQKRVKQKSGRLKSALVDQHFIAGIGNRYSDEICWQAELLPNRQLSSLSSDDIVRLFHSMRDVLSQAIDGHGYMDKPFYEGDKMTGNYRNQMKAHNREGEKCVRCGATIIMKEISSRKTYFCPECQH